MYCNLHTSFLPDPSLDGDHLSFQNHNFPLFHYAPLVHALVAVDRRVPHGCGPCYLHHAAKIQFELYTRTLDTFSRSSFASLRSVYALNLAQRRLPRLHRRQHFAFVDDVDSRADNQFNRSNPSGYSVALPAPPESFPNHMNMKSFHLPNELDVSITQI